VVVCSQKGNISYCLILSFVGICLLLGPEPMQEKMYCKMSDKNSNLLVKTLDRPGIHNLEIAFEKRLCHWGLVVAEPDHSLGHKNFLLDINASVLCLKYPEISLGTPLEFILYEG
jgi:hypothetical protein